MVASTRRIELADLRCVHELAVQRFPHEYLDEGLGAIGLFLHNPPKNAGYRSTPGNSITFASTGIDGVHFGSITNGNRFDPWSPVVMTTPMSLEKPNHIVGETLFDFLCLGCRHGYFCLGNLHMHFDDTIQKYQDPPEGFGDERCEKILQTMTRELSLEPWPDVRQHLLDLQLRIMPLLKMMPNP
jgi:hypothetical protein